LNKNKGIENLHFNWKNKFWDMNIPVNKNFPQSMLEYKIARCNGFINVGHYDALTYLPDDILVKVDRAAMSVSMETRAPFLDHRVLEFLISLPKDYLYLNGVSKRIAKDILYKYVPKEIVDRPKQGFSIPVSYWLKNDLKNWANKIIDEIPENSIFWDKKQIEKIWYEHQQSICDHPEKLWNILVLELFFKRKNLMDHDI
jgi:asparagine synthase (glutamine-hydrolysing)